MGEKTGKCLCGGVTFKATPKSNHVDACHCSDCRRNVGGPSFAVDCGTDLKFNSEDNISVYNSSSWAERGFCKQCGTALFWRLKDKSMIVVPAGAFDDLGDVALAMEFFVDQKPNYYSFEQETKKLTGQQVAEMFANVQED